MQHLGSKIGKFHSLLVGNLFKQFGLADNTWIAAVHTVNISPDFAAGCLDTGGKTGGGVIGAVTSEQYQFASGIAAAET